MREIKLRAWEPGRKVMIPWVDLVGFSVRGAFLDYGFIPMQYTGLKDKNGKEIYEGDILHNHRGYSGNEHLLCRWQEAIDDGNWTLEKPGFRFERINGTGTTIWISHRDIEIIGNIYENPELLK